MRASAQLAARAAAAALAVGRWRVVGSERTLVQPTLLHLPTTTNPEGDGSSQQPSQPRPPPPPPPAGHPPRCNTLLQRNMVHLKEGGAALTTCNQLMALSKSAGGTINHQLPILLLPPQGMLHCFAVCWSMQQQQHYAPANNPTCSTTLAPAGCCWQGLS